ncbi:MAG: acyl carrier protein [Deltaproteobacteria bacterium]|nr:acyl carrier protein [Deltaproteobacteria bacterium]
MNEQQIMTILNPMITRIVKLSATDHSLSLETNLFEIGLDSLGVMELIVDIENQLHVVFDDDELSPELFERLSALVSLLVQKLLTVPQQQEAGAA